MNWGALPEKYELLPAELPVQPPSSYFKQRAYLRKELERLENSEDVAQRLEAENKPLCSCSRREKGYRFHNITRTEVRVGWGVHECALELSLPDTAGWAAGDHCLYVVAAITGPLTQHLEVTYSSLLFIVFGLQLLHLEVTCSSIPSPLWLSLLNLVTESLSYPVACTSTVKKEKKMGSLPSGYSFTNILRWWVETPQGLTVKRDWVILLPV